MENPDLSRFCEESVALHNLWESVLAKLAKDEGFKIPSEFLHLESSFEWPKLVGVPAAWAGVRRSIQQLQKLGQFDDAIARRADFIASMSEEGFWDAASASFFSPPNVSGDELEIVLLSLLGPEFPGLAAVLAEHLKPRLPGVFAELGKIWAGRKVSVGGSRRKLYADSTNPRSILIRGWVSHYFWMMNRAARQQYIGKLNGVSELTKSIDEKLIREFSLVVHPDPPILGIREGGTLDFRSGWMGPRPTLAQLLIVKP